MTSISGDAPAILPPSAAYEPATSTSNNAFVYPGFRWFFAGLVCFALGVWIMEVAQRWVVQELTGSPFYVGLMAFGWGMSVVVFSFPGGVLADRVDRIRLITIARSIGVAAGVLLALLLSAGLAGVWHVIAFAIVWGASLATEVPSRQSLIPLIVHRNALPQAVAVTMGVWSTSIVVGPAISGWLIAALGARSCFFITALLHTCAIFCYRRLRGFLPPVTRNQVQEHPWRSFTGGVAYIRTNPTMLGLILLATLNAALSQSPLQALLPAFAADTLQGNASVFGLLLTFQGLGSVLANVALAVLVRLRHKGRIMMFGCFAAGFLLVGFSFMTTLESAIATMLVLGLTNGGFITLANTLIQTYVNEEMRGRVLSSLMLIWGVGSAGSLATGALGSVTSVPIALAVTGCLTVLAATGVLIKLPVVAKLN